MLLDRLTNLLQGYCSMGEMEMSRCSGNKIHPFFPLSIIPNMHNEPYQEQPLLTNVADRLLTAGRFLLQDGAAESSEGRATAG